MISSYAKIPWTVKESQAGIEQSEQDSQNVFGRVDFRTGDLPRSLVVKYISNQLKEHLAHVLVIN